MDEEEKDLSLPAEADGGGKPAKKDKKAKKPRGKKGGNGDEDDEEGGALAVILVTIFIILIWLAILALLVRLDVGGFGSGVLTPVLKDVPVINRILPGYPDHLSGNSISGNEYVDSGYTDLDSAVNRIIELEMQLAAAQDGVNNAQQVIVDQQAEIDRLRTFEENQVEFEKIKDEFYNEVVFGNQAPDISEYQKYYETIDPTNAQILYKQVVKQKQRDTEIEDFAKAYSAMKPKAAAGIFDTEIIMNESGLDTVVTILEAMGTDARGQILGAMDPDNAARVTRQMKPDDTVNTAITTGPVANIPSPAPAVPPTNTDTPSENNPG